MREHEKNGRFCQFESKTVVKAVITLSTEPVNFHPLAVEERLSRLKMRDNQACVPLRRDESRLYKLGGCRYFNFAHLLIEVSAKKQSRRGKSKSEILVINGFYLSVLAIRIVLQRSLTGKGWH